MSVVSTITLGKQPDFDALCSGEEHGYSVCLANTVANPRPVYSAMNSKDTREAVVTRLAEHVISLIDSMNSENLDGSVVSEITIGKSHVGQKGRNKVLARDPATWTVAGIPSRWTSYKNKGYSCLVVFECFCRSDVPQTLKDLGFDQQDLGLKFEDLVLTQLKKMKNTHHEADGENSDDDGIEDTLKTVKISNKDDGGGGKRSATYAGFVLYVAMKLSDTASSDESDSD